MKNHDSINKYRGYSKRKKGISLVILIIVIIVILILASAIIITLNTSNTIDESNSARYEHDRDQLQSAFTNTVEKIMAVKCSTVFIVPTELNNVKSGVKETTGQAEYIVEDTEVIGEKRGVIIFDTQKSAGNEYYTGVKLPIYNKETTWYVDDDGNISLKVGESGFGQGAEMLEGKIISAVLAVRNGKNIEIEVQKHKSDDIIDQYVYYIRSVGKEEWQEFSSNDSKTVISGLDEKLDYEIKVKVKSGDKEEESPIKVSKHIANPNPDVPDDEPPVVTINTNGGEFSIEPGSKEVNIPVKIIATDEISGIDELKYQLTTSETIPEENDENWKDISSNVQVIEKRPAGTYYLYVRAVDVAGNKSKVERSNPFYVKYKIKYDLNGGTGTFEDQLKGDNEDLKLNSDVPTKTGYTFLGWSTSKDESEIKYMAGSSYTDNESVVLYAIWNIKSYTVMFDANGGSEPNPQSITKNYNESIGELPTTSKQNYIFEGWYTSLTGGNKIESTTTIPSENTTYYARWTPDFNLQITKNISDITVSENEEVPLSIEATGNGNITYQWYYNTTNSTENGTIIEGATSKEYTVTTSMDMNQRYYYCIVTSAIDTHTQTKASNTSLLTVKKICTITFDANGGSEPNPKTITKKYNESIGELPTTSKQNYIFEGWYTSLTDGTKVESTNIMPEENVTYYAKWLPDPRVEITKNIENQDVVEGNNLTLSIEATGNVEVSYQWYYNTANSTENGIIIEGATNKEYSVTASMEMNQRYYYCVASTRIDDVTKEAVSNLAQITVKEANYSITKANVTTNYNTLIDAQEEAVSGAADTDGGMITMLKDVQEETLMMINKAITLNTNEKTLNTRNTITTEEGEYTFKIIGNGTLTSNTSTVIQNSSNVTLEIDGANLSLDLDSIELIHNYGILNVKNGNLNCKKENVISNRGAGRVNISGGTLIGCDEKTPPAIFNKDNEGVINITGGTISSKSTNAIYNKAEGTIEISGDTTNISSESNITIVNKGGTVNIRGGTLKALRANVINNKESGQVNISGGTIIGQSELTEAQIEDGTNFPTIWNDTDTGKINITGGNISTKVANAITNNAGGTVEISGNTTNILSENTNAIVNSATGQVNVKGGNISSNVFSTIYNKAGGTVEISGDTTNIMSENNAVIGNMGEGQVNISGGTLKALKANVISNMGTGQVNVNGGTIIGQNELTEAQIEKGSSSPAIWNETDAGKIKITGGNISSKVADIIYNKAGGTVEISGDTTNIMSENKNIIYNNEIGQVNIKGGILESINSAAVYNKDGTITVEGGTIKSLKSNVINNKGTGQVNMSGGTIIGQNEYKEGSTSSYPTIWNETDTGKINITGGNISSKVADIIYNKTGGTVEISGDTTNIMSENKNTIDNISAGQININGGTIESVNSSAINNKGIVNINGGTIKSLKSNMIYNKGTGQINITRGTLIGAQEGVSSNNVISNSENGRVKITGGNISSKVGSAIYSNSVGTVEISGDTTNITTERGNVIWNSGVGTVEISGDTTNLTTERGNVIWNSGAGQINIKGGKMESSNSTAIYNYKGTITIDGGTIKALKANIINNPTSGQVNINGGTLVGQSEYNEGSTSTYPAIINGSNEGKINITGGNMSCAKTNVLYNKLAGTITLSGNPVITSTVSAAVTNAGTGTIIINGGKITSPTGKVSVVNYSTGTVTVGNASAAISKTNPCIAGGNSVKNSNGGTFNFYNGIIKGSGAIYGGTLNNKRSGATYTTSTEGSYKTAFYQ